MGAVDIGRFQPRTLDKVERLLDLLEEMQCHPNLKGKFAMHGGTAINLFMLSVPRLSVDIDISYVGALPKEEMLAERPSIEHAIEEVGKGQGYNVAAGEGGHAGRTFVLRYHTDWGPDHVKVDCIYMNRSPLFPVRARGCSLRPDTTIPMFEDAELAGGKVKALFDRVKIRDLYDISNLKRHFDSVADPNGLVHKTLLYYASVSACFPNDLEGRSMRFVDKQGELESQLLPMLRLRDDQPTLANLMDSAEAFIQSYILPRNDDERMYLRRFAEGEYRPELLFGEGNIARAAAVSPEALWKLANLKKMSG